MMNKEEKLLLQQCIKSLSTLEQKFCIKLLNLEVFDENEIYNIKYKN